MIFWINGDDDCVGVDKGDDCGGAGSLRAIHEVISSVRPDLEVSLVHSGSGLPRCSIQFFHVGCWRNAGLVGRVGQVEGLKTSSEPRGSLGRGGTLDDLSDESIPEEKLSLLDQIVNFWSWNKGSEIEIKYLVKTKWARICTNKEPVT